MIILNILLLNNLISEWQEIFCSKSERAIWVNKTDSDNKLTSFNKQITSNKTKDFEVQKKLSSLTTKDYNFLLGKIYFTSNHGSQNKFAYESRPDILELKKQK